VAVYKFSNVSGFKNYQQYNDFLAGNPAVILDNGAYFPLGEFTLASAQANVTFTNIPQTYTHLQIRGIAKSSGVGNQDLKLRINGQTTVYTFHALYGNGGGGTALAAAATSQTYMKLAYNFVSASTNTNIFGGIIIDILDYKNTNKLKTFRSLGGVDNNGSGTMSFFSGFHTTTTAAITSIEIAPDADNFATFSNFALYGVLA
jgi:hypothetical protein